MIAMGGLLLALRRLVAYAIDIALLFAVLGGSQLVLSRTIGSPSWEAFGRNAWVLEGWVLLTFSLPSWAYFTLSDRSARGATLGKRVMRLRVESPDGRPPDALRALLRTAVKLLPWELTHVALMLPVPVLTSGETTAWQSVGLITADLAILVYVGVLFATRGRRSVHDLAAGTAVVPATQTVPTSS